jgi:methylated-DNA-protein-cysteine methyltransferase-like protein
MTPVDRQRVVAVVRALGEGEVSTYGDIAEVASLPRQARFVGHVLASHDDDDDLPWWRVVNAAGRLVPGLEVEQASRLRAEGVVVTGGRVRGAPVGRFSVAGRSPARTRDEGC